jgi:nicotinamidase/pyrazinamidase
MNEAFLIVDLQYDFLPGGALEVEGGDQIIPIINQIIGKFSLVIVSQDWHPEGHVSFAKTHNMEVGESIDVHGKKQKLWPVHCVAHTHGAAVVKTLNKDRIHKYVHKGIDKDIDSYSAFFDNDGIKSTGLDEFLRENTVTRLYVAGLATDFCVLYTVLDARELGYEVVVIKDACKAVFDEKEPLRKMQEAGAEIVTSSNL